MQKFHAASESVAIDVSTNDDACSAWTAEMMPDIVSCCSTTCGFCFTLENVIER